MKCRNPYCGREVIPNPPNTPGRKKIFCTKDCGRRFYHINIPWLLKKLEDTEKERDRLREMVDTLERLREAR
jgi:hypothetical protein